MMVKLTDTENQEQSTPSNIQHGTDCGTDRYNLYHGTYYRQSRMDLVVAFRGRYITFFILIQEDKSVSYVHLCIMEAIKLQLKCILLSNREVKFDHI